MPNTHKCEFSDTAYGLVAANPPDGAAVSAVFYNTPNCRMRNIEGAVTADHVLWWFTGPVTGPLISSSYGPLTQKTQNRQGYVRTPCTGIS
jgi:hypothetical protein